VSAFDQTKVLATCSDCAHQWKVKQYRIEWAQRGKYKLTCRACDMRRSANHHYAMYRQLLAQANAIDAKRRAKKGAAP
jgi:hypothetical protein